MVNYTVVQGRLCADPELRRTQSGIAVCTFRVAWSKKYKEIETKLFLTCVAWRATGEFVENYFRKGQEIVVEGELSTSEWTDRDGNNRQTNELTVSQVHFCGRKGDTHASPQTGQDAPSMGYQGQNGYQPGEFAAMGEDEEADLPF